MTGGLHDIFTDSLTCRRYWWRGRGINVCWIFNGSQHICPN
jgi:hypothetical protein